jgi:hypothetical protein
MYVANDGTTVVHLSTADALENVEASMQRIREHSGSNANCETQAALDCLESLRDGWQAAADEETIERWGYHQLQYKAHRTLADEHKAALGKLTGVYQAAVLREQKRWDAAQAHAWLKDVSANGHKEVNNDGR